VRPPFKGILLFDSVATHHDSVLLRVFNLYSWGSKVVFTSRLAFSLLSTFDRSLQRVIQSAVRLKSMLQRCIFTSTILGQHGSRCYPNLSVGSICLAINTKTTNKSNNNMTNLKENTHKSDAFLPTMKDKNYHNRRNKPFVLNPRLTTHVSRINKATHLSSPRQLSLLAVLRFPRHQSTRTHVKHGVFVERRTNQNDVDNEERERESEAPPDHESKWDDVLQQSPSSTREFPEDSYLTPKEQVEPCKNNINRSPPSVPLRRRSCLTLSEISETTVPDDLLIPTLT